jgi:hypothetical protein
VDDEELPQHRGAFVDEAAPQEGLRGADLRAARRRGVAVAELELREALERARVVERLARISSSARSRTLSGASVARRASGTTPTSSRKYQPMRSNSGGFGAFTRAFATIVSSTVRVCPPSADETSPSWSRASKRPPNTVP